MTDRFLFYLALALLAGILRFAAFPPVDLVLLAPVCLVPLFTALASAANARQRFLFGYLSGAVYWGLSCYWIYHVLQLHGGLGKFGAVPVFLLFCLIKGLHLGVFSLVFPILFNGWLRIPLTACGWVILERSHGIFGFPWQVLGNAAIDMDLPVRLAPLTGVYGISFVFTLLNAGLAAVLLRARRRELLWIALALCVYLLPPIEHGQAVDTGRAVLVQPNASTTQTWTVEALLQFQDSLAFQSLRLALQNRHKPVDLIVWPEVPAPIYYYRDPQLKQLAAEIARLTGAHLLIGTVVYTPRGQPLNSSVLVAPDGQPIGQYDKVILVPFGEYVPRYFGFVKRITREVSDFVPGSGPKVLQLNGYKLGTLICYEAVFPEYVRRFTLQGAQVLVNISNDGYFGKTAARYQHLKIVRMRAVENGRWFLRATNDGITAIIDPRGRIKRVVPPFVETSTEGEFEWLNHQTFYVRYGEWFIWLCLVVVAARIGWAARRRYLRAAN